VGGHQRLGDDAPCAGGGLIVELRRRWLDLALITGVSILLFFFRLGSFGLVGADEPRYAQVAREMLERRDWVTPVLYGHTWLEKPIGYYWGALVSFKLFGVTDAAARIPSAIAATVMVLFIYFVLGRIRPAARVDAALMTASGALILGMARAASTDMVLSAPFAIAMLAWYAFESDRTSVTARGWLIVSYAALGAATLAKGPVAPVLAGAIIAAYAVLRRDGKVIVRALWIPGILAFLVVAGPWYVLVQHRTPEFFRVFIMEHNLGRFGSDMFRHKQPFWYYVPVMLIATAPWTFFVATAFVTDIRDWWRSRKEALEQQDGFVLFLLLWIIIPVAFFSISKSKLPGYILPAVPPALILGADWIHRRSASSERIPFWLAGAHAVLLSSLAAVLLMTPTLILKLPTSPQAMMIGGFLGSVIFIGVVLSLLIRGWGMLRFATLVPLVLYVSFILRVLAPTIDLVQSSRPVVELLGDARSLPVATFKVKRELPYGMAFYLNRAPIPYDGLEVSPHEYTIPRTIPQGEHVVIVREGNRDELRQMVAGRAVSFIGYLRAQHLELYRVSESKTP
jgi:4-amino-4-deoxy-L-arabinose transferase-like glycosyltransferase